MKVMSKGQATPLGLSKYADRDEPSSATRMVISPWGRVQVFSTAAVASAGTRLMGISQSPAVRMVPSMRRTQPSAGGSVIRQETMVSPVVRKPCSLRYP